MDKIASPKDLQTELHHLLAYASSAKPSREKLAARMRELAAAVQEKVFTDGRGNPTGPNTPWGRADGIRTVMRGVIWANTPGHGGLGVARSVAGKVLSSAARRLGEFKGGYFWYEEDVACAIPFYEHPEWVTALGFSGGGSEEGTIRSYFPKYFDMLNDGVIDVPRPTPGMKLRVLREI